MACEDELAEVERLERLMDEENEDFWMSSFKTVGNLIATGGGIFVAISTSPTGIGTYAGAATATGSGLSAAANFWGAWDAWDDYNQLEDQYNDACGAYRDCMG